MYDGYSDGFWDIPTERYTSGPNKGKLIYNQHGQRIWYPEPARRETKNDEK
jgi:hypothetical protein